MIFFKNKLYFFQLVVLLLTPFLFIFDFFIENTNLAYFLHIPLILFLCILIYIANSDVRVVRWNSKAVIIFILMLILTLNFNVEFYQYSSYITSLLFLMLFFVLLRPNTSLIQFKKHILIIIYLYFFISLLLSFSNDYYVFIADNFRFRGLGSSSNVSGIISLVFFVVYKNLGTSRILKILMYLLLIYLLFKEGGRINLMVGILMPCYYYFMNYYKIFTYTKTLFFIIFSILLLVYPISSTLNFTDIDKNTVDASINTRVFYSALLLEEIATSELRFLLFGHGSHSAISMIGDMKIKPHNDFLRMLYDYGVLFFILFNFYIYKLFSQSKEYSFLIVIYYASFYHNMVFDLWLVVFMLFIYQIVNCKTLLAQSINIQPTTFLINEAHRD